MEEHEHHQPVGLRVSTNKAVGIGEEQHQHAGDCDEIEESSVSEGSKQSSPLEEQDHHQREDWKRQTEQPMSWKKQSN